MQLEDFLPLTELPHDREFVSLTRQVYFPATPEQRGFSVLLRAVGEEVNHCSSSDNLALGIGLTLTDALASASAKLDAQLTRWRREQQLAASLRATQKAVQDAFLLDLDLEL